MSYLKPNNPGGVGTKPAADYSEGERASALMQLEDAFTRMINAPRPRPIDRAFADTFVQMATGTEREPHIPPEILAAATPRPEDTSKGKTK
jgi:hypothetical protein